MRSTMIAAPLLSMLAILASPAAAQTGQCYEEIGCISSQNLNARALTRLSCQALWEVRNRVYQDRGYCFQTERALAAFSNQGCRFTKDTQVPFNAYERSNIKAIRKVERSKGCP